MEADVLSRTLSRARDGHLRISGSLQLLIQAAHDVSHFQVEGSDLPGEVHA
jgi:hypothetical protein